jgi:hypothetical protein
MLTFWITGRIVLKIATYLINIQIQINNQVNLKSQKLESFIRLSNYLILFGNWLNEA